MAVWGGNNCPSAGTSILIFQEEFHNAASAMFFERWLPGILSQKLMLYRVVQHEDFEFRQ